MCPSARVMAAATFSGAPEISSGRSRAALASYSRLILRASAARQHAEDVVPGYAGLKYAGLRNVTWITPAGAGGRSGSDRLVAGREGLVHDDLCQVSAPGGAARSCLPSYEHRASAALIRDYGVIARSWRPSRSRKTCSRQPPPSCQSRWPLARPTRWRGPRWWLSSPPGPWPASTSMGCSCTGSPRPSCVTASRPPRQPPPVSAPPVHYRLHVNRAVRKRTTTLTAARGSIAKLLR